MPDFTVITKPECKCSRYEYCKVCAPSLYESQEVFDAIKEQTAEIKDTNPKDAIGMTKLPMHLIPGTAKAHLALAFLEGALKYGKYNWRVAGVRSSIYLDALERHLEKYKNGEDTDPKTRVNHLASVMACAAIILDASAKGKLTDDRPPAAPTSEIIDAFAEHVLYLQDLYRAENPHQYTIEDDDGQA